MNWDATIIKSMGKLDIGIIARDHEGNVMATKRMQREGFPKPFLAEALGALHVAVFAFELGMRKIILEGDALQVIKHITQGSVSWHIVGIIIYDVK